MLTPREDLVLVELAPAKTMEGSLHVPDSAQQKPSMGWVVAAGPGKQKACLNCGTPHVVCPMPEVGEFVLFPENAGMPQELNEKEYRLIRATDIHAHDPEMRRKATVEQPDAVPQI